MSEQELDVGLENFPIRLSDGTVVRVESEMQATEEDVAFEIPKFGDVAKAIQAITSDVMGAIRKAKPKKATIELGVAVTLESGHATAILVKGSGNANLKITLEWEGDIQAERDTPGG